MINETLDNKPKSNDTMVRERGVWCQKTKTLIDVTAVRDAAVNDTVVSDTVFTDTEVSETVV